MNVYTFYSPIEGKQERDELALIELWKRSWSAMGWRPVVLSNESIEFDDNVRALVRKLQKLPSINKSGLDYSCYLRWLAVAQQGGGFMSDYDVINYAFNPRPAGELTVYDRFIPCLVSGTREDFFRAIDWFAQKKMGLLARFTKLAHTSDMLVMMEHQTEFRQTRECVEYGLGGWESAPAVHYCNRAMKPGNFMPRHEHIERLRPLPNSAAA